MAKAAAARGRIAVAADEVRDVSTGAKGPPRPGQDDRPGVLVLPEQVPHLTHRLMEVVGHGIELFRLVHCDHPQGAVLFHKQSRCELVILHGCPPDSGVSDPTIPPGASRVTTR